MPGFAGLDASAYPGNTRMAWLKANTNFRWTGFYLGPSPSHGDAGWMTRRAALLAQGWGFAPLYVGQQVTGPGSHHSDAAHGNTDGAHACGLMTSAGFPAGSYVYLDLENGAPFTPAQHTYVAHWVDAVIGGGFGPGVYCSHTFAVEVHTLRSAARIWAFKVPTVVHHPVPGHNYPDSHPAGSGYPGAYMWQLGQGCIIDVPGAGGDKLLVDLDTSVSSDPSS